MIQLANGDKDILALIYSDMSSQIDMAKPTLATEHHKTIKLITAFIFSPIPNHNSVDKQELKKRFSGPSI